MKDNKGFLGDSKFSASEGFVIEEQIRVRSVFGHSVEFAGP